MCYRLYSHAARRHYTGITTDICKRLKQHNGLLKGGAKSTRVAKDWRIVATWGPFKDRSSAQKFEYMIKTKPKKKVSLA